MPAPTKLWLSPAVVMRPIELLSTLVNHSAPSGPAVIPCGVDMPAYAVISPAEIEGAAAAVLAPRAAPPMPSASAAPARTPSRHPPSRIMSPRLPSTSLPAAGMTRRDHAVYMVKAGLREEGSDVDDDLPVHVAARHLGERRGRVRQWVARPDQRLERPVRAQLQQAAQLGLRAHGRARHRDIAKEDAVQLCGRIGSRSGATDHHHAARPDRAQAQLPRRLANRLQHGVDAEAAGRDRKSTRLNSSHTVISYAVFCLKKKKKEH